jgi:hypothetical protein
MRCQAFPRKSESRSSGGSSARGKYSGKRLEMGKLANWDFGDEKINSGTQQVNRQKSALNIEVIEIDKEGNTGVFSDKKNGIVTATLSECECKDFNFIGNSPRKSFFPCMHIYRLAMELSLMEEKQIYQEIGGITPEIG